MNEEQITKILEKIVNKVYILQFIIACSGILVNLPHLFILLQNSMRVSSTNSLLIGIGIYDLIVLFVVVYQRIQDFRFSQNDNCLESYQLSEWISDQQRDILEQTSFWLGLFLALIRLLIMKYPSKNVTLSNPYSGYIIVLVVTTISVMISGFFYSQVNGSLDLSLQMCTGASDDLERILHYFEFVSGASQVLITIVYPMLAVCLILEMRKAAVFALSRKNSVERTRSAKMILLMTVFYVICSAPCGTLDFLQLFIHGNFVLETFVEYGSVFISILFCLNATSHTLLNFTMSSRYRDTVKTVFSWKRSQVGSTPSAFNSTSHK